MGTLQKQESGQKIKILPNCNFLILSF